LEAAGLLAARQGHSLFAFPGEKPSEMLNKYAGNPLMERFFAERRNWLIFKLMEGMFLQMGTFSLGLIAAEQDEDDGLEFLGGASYLELIAHYDVSQQSYEEWLGSLKRQCSA
jgi:hypothetical protein